jgi:hypothetical protein
MFSGLERNRAMRWIDIVFDGPPAPEAPRLVEIEDEKGRRIEAGTWIKRPNGTWALRLT